MGKMSDEEMVSYFTVEPKCSLTDMGARWLYADGVKPEDLENPLDRKFYVDWLEKMKGDAPQVDS